MGWQFGDVWDAGTGCAESLLGLPQTAESMLWALIAVGGLTLIAVVITMCWSVGSGGTSVNQLAETAVKAL